MEKEVSSGDGNKNVGDDLKNRKEKKSHIGKEFF